MSSASDFVIENGVLTKYVGPGGDVVIPEGVIGIGEKAFLQCNGLKSVTIPEGVTSIGHMAFSYCPEVTNVTIPKSMTYIGKSAFSGCVNLTSIEIPGSVTSIGWYAFSGCSHLTDVVILEGTESIGAEAFSNCTRLTRVAIPKSIKSIGEKAFYGCKALSDSKGFVIVHGILLQYLGTGKSVVIPDDVMDIGEGAFSYNVYLTHVVIQDSVKRIGSRAFYHCVNLKSMEMLGDSVTIYCEAFSQCIELEDVFAPNLAHAEWKEEGLGMQAARTFVLRSERYSDPAVIKGYVGYIASQRKKLLPEILKKDRVEILKLLVEEKKITKKNVEQDYLLPARQCKADKCIAYLETNFAEVLMHTVKQEAINPLWDGSHFSFDGKKLLKYMEEQGRTCYEIPKGTVEIGKDAFFMTQLTEIVIPSSVTTIRNDAFTARSGKPLFVRLPDSLKTLPAEAFAGGMFEEDLDVDDETKYYFISSPVKTLADDLCIDSENKGYRCMIYTGGPLDDLPQKAKPFAVRGFLYAAEHGLEDLSKWRNSYLDHIRRNEKTYIKQVPADAYLLHLMTEENLLSEKGTKTILDEAEANCWTDVTALLLEYQRKHFGGKQKKDDLSLSNDDPEMKRMQKIAARREAIKDQKGIKGIVFVETGEMKNFGDYDEYTGAKDMSDLKAYIEQRGGFLRSAVSSNTDYLICNDPNSDSIKSKKAKELGVPVITEEQFLKMANEKE